jgi:hypothetical protein
MHILVAGAAPDHDAELKEQIGAFCKALGEAVSTHGHVLLSGCRNELDSMIAEATYEHMLSRGDPDHDKRVISYVLARTRPIHNHGTIIRSRLTDWDINSESFYVPEQIQQAEAVILVGGGEGTFRAANWARIAKKPLLPFTAFGGAAEKVYGQELNDFDGKYAGFVDKLEYEQLNTVKDNWEKRAADIIALAEKVAESHSVLVIMSYTSQPDVEDAYDSFVQVCKDLGYHCERLTEENAGERILPEILERIERAAFVIVDLTGLRPNVFYELGYADGLGKKVVITARDGTELPFDVKDIPTIHWSSQRRLREDLRKRIISVVKPATVAASPPVG